MSKINSTHRKPSAEDETPQRQLAEAGGCSWGGLRKKERKKEKEKESGSVYSLGILAALRRMDTQEEPAA